MDNDFKNDVMMKRIHHILSRLLLVLAVAATALPAAAYDFMVDGIAYDINADGKSVTVTYEQYHGIWDYIPAYDTPCASLTIPSKVTYSGKTYSVTSIGDSAFQNCGFTGSLTIPNSVTEIGHAAFWGCNGFTGSLTIPESVTSIGYDAFAYCSGFTGSLTIPNTLTAIGGDAFYNCSGFSELNWNATECADFSSSRGALEGLSNLKSVVIGNTVKRIPAYFLSNVVETSGCSLTIGNSVTSIGSSAFYGCSGFTELDWNATECANFSSSVFNDLTNLKNVFIGNNVKRIPAYFLYDVVKTSVCSLTIPNSVTSIGECAFLGCSGFTGSLTIPNSVTEIGSFAFSGCSGFTGSLTIGNSVTAIGGYSFGGCSGFTDSLNIPNSVTEIGHCAFSGCSGLTGSLTIPESVNYIGSYAFGDCSGFTGSLTMPESVTEIGYGVFYGCSGFTGSLTIPNSVTSIGAEAFSGCSGFTGSLTIPNSVTEIGDNAFEDCSGFTKLNFNATNCGDFSYEYYPFKNLKFKEVNIGKSVKCIPSCFLRDCKDITGSLTIPNSVTKIGGAAFRGCSGFTGSLNIPNSVAEIGGEAFASCSGFTGSLTIGNSVTSIGSYAFYGCRGFTGSLTIPNSVTEISNCAFYGCSGFTGSLTIPNSVTTIGDEAFSDCSGFTGPLTIPNSVTEIGGYAFSGCSGFTGSLNIPNSVTYICSYAFEGCSGFTSSLTIPNTVTHIGGYAFSGCSGFTGSLTIPNSVTFIGGFAFSGCSGFTTINNHINHPSDVSLGNSVFNKIPKDKCKLYVTIGRVDEFKQANQWKEFKTIVEGDWGIPVSSISLNPTTLTLYAGETQTLTPTIQPWDASIQTLQWSSSNTNVASVDQNGTVSAQKPGTTIITAAATDGSGVKATCTVTVIQLVMGITLNKTSTSIFIGNSETLIAAIAPSYASNQILQWSSSNSSVATVDQNGVVTAKALGIATITVAATDGSGVKASCKVTVTQPVTGITLNKTSTIIFVGKSETLTTTIVPSNATNKSLQWSSSNTSVATVDQNGKVSALKPGSAVITASATDGSGVTASCEVAVYIDFAIYVPSLYHTRGATASVTDLTFDLENYYDITGMQFNLWLPEGVTLAMNDGLPDVWLDDARKARNHSVSVSTNDNGSYRVLVSSPTNRVFTGHEGTLLHINVVLAQYHPVGDYQIRFTGIELVEPDETQHKLSNCNSLVRLSYVLGDADADVSVDVADYTVTALKILNRPTNRFYNDAADVNGDNAISVTDLVGITNIGLGIRPIEVKHAPSINNAQCTIHNAQCLQGSVENGTITLEMENDRAIAGVQMDVRLPAGVTLEGIEAVGRAAGFPVTMATLDDGTVRLLLSEFSGRNIDAGSGEVLRLKLGSTTDGIVEVSDIVATERDLTEHHPDGLTIAIGTTAVGDLLAGEVRIWGESGNLIIMSPRAGTAQLVRPNGIATPLRVQAGRNEYRIVSPGIYMVRMGTKTVKIKL